MACLIAATTVSTVPELERTAARSLTGLRTGTLIALLLLSSGGVLALAAGTIGLLGPASALRNLSGLTGLGLVGVAIAGNAFGWLFPTLMAAASIVGGSSGRPDGTVYAWAWSCGRTVTFRPYSSPYSS